MNKRNTVIIFMMLLISSLLFAEKMAISPVIVYDHNSTKTECETDFRNVFYEQLEQEWFSGFIKFMKLNASDYGDVYTVLDANKVCGTGGFDYILYGYVQRNENSWYGNLKLYSVSSKRIEKEFFASDDISNLQRFINILSEKIISGVYEITGIKASGGKPSNVIPFRMSIPIEAFYWNPLGKKWNEVYTGIAGGSIGVDFVPPQKKMTVFGWLLYFSFGMNVCYSNGKGKDNCYPLNLHSVQILTPINIHVDFNEIHSFFIKASPYYEFEFLNVMTKYKSEEFYCQNMRGLESGLGYEFTATRFLKLYTKTDFDFHFSRDGFCDVKVGLGAKINVYNGASR